jgi:putative ABC transport system permease protein
MQEQQARGVRWIDSAVTDFRFGLRHVARRPISALTIVLVLALGIGFNAAIFLLLYSFVNSPPASIMPDDSQVRIRGISRGMGRPTIGREFSYPEYREYAAQQKLFSSVAAWTSLDAALDVGGEQERLVSGAATYVTANYFQVLGVRPILGAGLPTDVSDTPPSPPLVAVISHVVWERHFDRAPDIVGRTLKVNGVPVTIAGVAPRRFVGARTGGSQVRVWVPLGARPVLQRGTSFDLGSYDAATFGIVARLQPGVTPEQTLPTVEAIAARAAREATRMASGDARSTDVVPLRADNYFPPSGETPGIAGRVITLMIPLIILAITCTNVSALQAALAVARRREIAVRLSLGASRRRVVRQLVTESVLLAVAAGAVGLFVVWALWRLFDSSIPDLQLMLDWRAFAFTFGIALATGVLFGLSPALHATRLAVSEGLKDTASGVVVAARSRLQSALVIAQIAFTQPALLLMGSLILTIASNLPQLPSTLVADRVLDVRFNTNPRYGALDQKREDTLGRLQERLAALPGVATIVPQENDDEFFQVAVHPDDAVSGTDAVGRFLVRSHAAPAGYFSLMGIPIVRGRDFDAGDRSDGRAMVIGADLARRLWGSTDPIGRRLMTAGPNRRSPGPFVVVGVVDEPARDHDAPRIFAPSLRITGHFLIRTHGPADAVIPVVRSIAMAEAPDLPLMSARTLAAIEAGERNSIVRLITAASGGGAVALFLAAIGLYSVVAFAVGQRIREIGIRTALGAGKHQVVGLFLFRGLRLSVAGLAIGLTLSLIAVRLMAAAQGEDPPAGILWVTTLVAVVVIGVALLATWIPARRAARIDPLHALRVD